MKSWAFFKLFKKKRWLNFPITFGLALVFVLLICALVPNLISHFSPYTVDVEKITQSPSALHIMGTDDLGRDIFARVVNGARISLMVGISATAISMAIGLFIGLIAGFYGGIVDTILMRITETVWAFPTALFAIAVLAPFENPSADKVFLCLGLIGWPSCARLVRSQVLYLRETDYIVASKALGLTEARIILRHILPNILAPIIVLASLAIPGNILTEAWLSFLGLGAQPPTPSWGIMITEGQAYLTTKPWICIFPGLAIFITVLGFNLFGDGLRDYLDPKLKNR